MHTTPDIPPENPVHHTLYTESYDASDPSRMIDADQSVLRTPPQAQPDHLPASAALYNDLWLDAIAIDNEGYPVNPERARRIDLANVTKNLAAVAVSANDELYGQIGWAQTLSEAGRRRDDWQSPLWDESATIRQHRLLQTPHGHAVIARVIDDVLAHEYLPWQPHDRVRYELAVRAELAAMQAEQTEQAAQRAALRRPPHLAA